MKAVMGLCGVAAIALAAGADRPSRGASLVRPVSPNPVTSPATVVPPVTAPTPAGEAPPAASARPASSPRPTLTRFKAVAAEGYSAMVRRIARRHSVEWKLVMAIIASESGGDPSAVSPAGAVGLMQLMPDTASDLGVDPWDPEQNVEGAVRYLSWLLSTFGSEDLSLVAYNAGPGFAKRYRDGTVELGAETRAFLMRVGALRD